MAAPLDPPLRIDWLTDAAGGRLGLTFLPGKHGASLRYPGRVYRRDLEADLATLRDAGVRRLILLVEDHELQRWGDLAITERGRATGVEVVRVPIPDGAAPPSIAAMDDVIAQVRSAPDGTAAVACMGGVGRTGTVAACWLVASGLPSAQAVSAVRRTRHPTAVETAEQEEFVERYGRERGTWSDRPGSDGVAIE